MWLQQVFAPRPPSDLLAIAALSYAVNIMCLMVSRPARRGRGPQSLMHTGVRVLPNRPRINRAGERYSSQMAIADR